MMLNFKKGFTLVELIVVLVIISIGSTMTFLSIAHKLSDKVEKDFVRDTYMLVKKTRVDSIISYRLNEVCIVPSERAISSALGKIVIPETVEVKMEGLVEDSGRYCVVFMKNGGSSGGKIFFLWGKYIKKLTIDQYTGIPEFDAV